MSDFTKEVIDRINEMDAGGVTYERDSMEADLIYACNELDRQAVEIKRLRGFIKKWAITRPIDISNDLEVHMEGLK